MKIIKEKTVAFCGFVPTDLKIEDKLIVIEPEQLHSTVIGLYRRGYTTFLSGMGEGFELVAAETVTKVRMKLSEIRFVAVIPFMGQELNYSNTDKEIYQLLNELANDCVLTSENFSQNAYFIQRDFLVKNSSLIVSCPQDDAGYSILN